MHELNQKDQSLIWHPFTPLLSESKPIVVTEASGVFLHTLDGRKIIDAVSSWWVNLHGHSHPHIAAAVAAQASRLDHVIFAGFTHAPAITLAERVLSILPKNQERVFFSDNGSTAVEVAVKMAVQYWRNRGIEKKRIIALDGAYHGDTFGAMAVGERGLFTAPFSDMLFDVNFLEFPNADREQRVIDQFKKLVSQGDTAVFIYEPLVQGASGMRMYREAVLNELLQIAHSHDVVCIADEVFTGFGRTGKYFASDYLEQQPDIVAISKGITGGTMPLSITSCSDKILDAFRTDDFSKTFFHGHSYTANPIACAAANASFEILTSEVCQQQISMISRTHSDFVTELTNYPVVSNARSRGTIMALDIKTNEGDSYSNALRKKIYPFFLERDILLRPLGNTIYMVPPYVITEAQLKAVYDSIREFLSKVAG
ncbi:adenosylmethionine--8-amino-7-oxononanoate transaminase [Chryseolinea sp. T2]|uniref:adenosylmethionine--8-amino-7-oxononanoate transaminase n=1 Tax=Chryseolinea sp. T2 TaxID=3129255 RepID=UPI003076B14C